MATASSAGVLAVRSRLRGGPPGAAAASAASHVALGGSCSGNSATLANRANVAFGRPVKLHGLLMSRLPLAGQPVAVTAPDNGSDAFTEAAVAPTGSDGRWTATLPPGPSRIIEGSYGGSPTVLPATGSATAITPAKIELIRVTPNQDSAWGSTVRITGRVLGGYIPSSSKLLRLDLGVVGIPGLSKIQGIPNVAPDGRFTTTYTFGHASGVVRFWLMVSSLPRRAIFPIRTRAFTARDRDRRRPRGTLPDHNDPFSRPHHHPHHKHKHRLVSRARHHKHEQLARAEHRRKRR